MKLLAGFSLLAFALAVPVTIEAAPAISSGPFQAKPVRITHRVQQGETLYGIARSAGIPLAELKRRNGLSGNTIRPGQILVLREQAPSLLPAPAVKAPSSPAPSSRPDKATAEHPTHRVKKGETLYRIARDAGIPVAEFKRRNGLSGNTIRPGQVLVLRETPLPAAPVLADGLRLDGEAPEEALAAVEELEPEGMDFAEEDPEAMEALERIAFRFLTTPYRFGGNGGRGLDCSGFVQQVFREMGFELPRTAREQYRLGNDVAPADLQSGDLLFFRTYASYPSHVGIYLGDNRMIHASVRQRRVVIADPDAPYFRKRFIGARRLAMPLAAAEGPGLTAPEHPAGPVAAAD